MLDGEREAIKDQIKLLKQDMIEYFNKDNALWEKAIENIKRLELLAEVNEGIWELQKQKYEEEITRLKRMVLSLSGGNYG